MRYIAGVITGVVVGALGTIAYSVATDTDLREVFKRAQAELEDVDINEIGAQIQTGIANAQAEVDASLSDLQARTDGAVEQVAKAIEDYVEPETAEPVASRA